MTLFAFMMVFIFFVAWAIIGIIISIEWDIGNADDAKIWKIVFVSGILGGPILFIVCLVGKILQLINTKGLSYKINKWISE